MPSGTRGESAAKVAGRGGGVRFFRNWRFFRRNFCSWPAWLQCHFRSAPPRTGTVSHSERRAKQAFTGQWQSSFSLVPLCVHCPAVASPLSLLFSRCCCSVPVDAQPCFSASQAFCRSMCWSSSSSSPMLGCDGWQGHTGTLVGQKNCRAAQSPLATLRLGFAFLPSAGSACLSYAQFASL